MTNSMTIQCDDMMIYSLSLTLNDENDQATCVRVVARGAAAVARSAGGISYLDNHNVKWDPVPWYLGNANLI